MAKDRGNRPTHYIAVTAKVGNGKYEKGPYIGMWAGDDDYGPMFRGNVSGKYLDELFDFIKDHGEDAVSFAVFKSRGDKDSSNRRNRDEDEQDAAPRGRRSSGRREEKEDRGSRGHREEKESSRDSGKRGGKGGKWEWD